MVSEPVNAASAASLGVVSDSTFSASISSSPDCKENNQSRASTIGEHVNTSYQTIEHVVLFGPFPPPFFPLVEVALP